MADGVLLGAVCYQEYHKGYLDFLELAAEIELEWVEFKYEYPLCKYENSKKYYEIRKRANLLEIGLSMHTAFDGLNIASIDKDERISSLQKVKESIRAAGEMEISDATLHAGHLMSTSYSEKNWNESKKNNIDSIIELVSFADKLGITLCLENGNAFKRSTLKHGLFSGDLKYIRDNVGSELKYTIDFGHALYFKTDPSFLVSELGTKNVKLSHLHSNSGLADSHSPLGTGVLELEKLIKEYMKEKWTFPLSLEMKSEKNLRNSLMVVREVIKKLEGN